jgi:histone deacetylase 6
VLHHCAALTTEADCRHKIPSILSFVSGSLRPIKSETDPLLSSWYKANSLIYVSPDHACWNDEQSAHKVKKQRFGGVRCAEVTGLSAMMQRYEAEAQSWVLAKVRELLGDDDKEGGGADGDETEDEMLELRLGVTGNGRAVIL